MVFFGISLWPAISRAENPHIFKSKICSIFLSVSIRVCRNCSFSILSGSCWISRTTKGSSSAFCVYSFSLFEKCSQNLLSALKSCYGHRLCIKSNIFHICFFYGASTSFSSCQTGSFSYLGSLKIYFTYNIF